MSDFKNNHLSVSRLNLYEQCPRQFFYKYVNKTKPILEGDRIAADFGVVVHLALEGVYKWVVENDFVGPFPLDRAIEMYREEWRSANLAGGGVEVYQDGLQILRTFAKSNPEVDAFRILDVEHAFDIPIRGFSIVGFIDRIEKVDNETVRIIDYKTSRKLYSKEELEGDLQMGVYGWIGRQRFPWAKKFEFVFEMLRFDKRQRTYRTIEELEDVGGYVEDIGKKTESEPAITDGGWPERLNPNCSYCSFTDRCDTFKKAILGEHPYTKRSDEDIAGLAKERLKVHNVAKLCYERRDRIDQVLRNRLLTLGMKEELLDGVVIRFTDSSETSFPESVVDVFRHAGISREEAMKKICRIDPKAVRELAESIEGPKGKLVQTMLDALEEKRVAFSKFEVRAAPKKKR